MDASELVSRWRVGAGRAARAGGRHLERALGGRDRTRVIVLLGCVLALSSADAATVGASATQLRSALHIDNTDIGLLVTVNSLVAAVASLPFGVVADRFKRTRTLGLTIVLWGVAMLWSATSSTFGRLLLSRMLLGIVTAAAGPVVASLVGDYFDGSERGRVYSYVLTGEIAGAGIGFAVTGDIAALSWRAAFVILALPAFVLAWYVMRMPEPVRGGRPLLADGQPAPPPPRPGDPDEEAGLGPTDAQRLAAERGVRVDWDHVVGPNVRSMGIIEATRAVLAIRTNVVLIIASAAGYFYLSGIETFAVEYVKEQYGVDQAVANLLLLVLGFGALVGVLLGGSMSDRLLQRGWLNARIVVAGVAAMGASVLFLPAILTRSPATAVPYLTIAAFMLSAQNPPIDAARLDIVPPLLWGRAEGIRTSLRTLAQSLAPVLFGASSEHLFGGGRAGLEWTFSLLLLVLAGSGVVLLRARRSYPTDVATAEASRSSMGTERKARPAPPPGRGAGPAGRDDRDGRDRRRSDGPPAPPPGGGPPDRPLWPDPPPPPPAGARP